MFLIVLMHALYGCTFTISKILINFANPIFVIGIRMIIAGTILGAYSAFFVKNKVKIDAKAMWYILQIAVVGIYLPYVLRYWSLKFLPVTKTALLYNIQPFAAYLFSYLFFSEKMTWKKAVGLVIGVSSVVPLLIAQQTPSEQAMHSFGFLSWPEIAMLASVTCFSYGWVVMKRLVLHNSISPARINGLNMLIGGVLALGTSFGLESSQTINDPYHFFFWLALIILITNLICYNLYAVLLRIYSATLLSLGGLFAPVSAAVTSWFYFGEAINWDAYASGGLVIVGFILFYSEELRAIKDKKDDVDDNSDLEECERNFEK